ncbi:LysR family transcriptional regulator [Bacillus paramycoides]|uniref:LysR family transcriptional regulator n=1 Tax=Bacillus paramycoides TaxID=2026194 RepID=UPI00381F625E
MQITQLQYFLTVARLEHMSKAALKLQISQSFLSKTMARLEDDIGVPLFDRKGKSIRLNEYGRIFYKKVEKVLFDLGEAIEEIQELANIREDSLSINVMNSKLLPSLFSTFYKKRPHIKIHQYTLPDAIALQKLLDGTLDLMIVPNPIIDDKITWVPLFNEDVYLLVPKSHLFANRKSISLIEATDERFIIFEEGQSMRITTDRLFQRAGFTPKISFEGDELSIILQLVNEGAGISFFPEYSFLGSYLENTSMLKISDSASFQTVGIACLKERKSSFIVNSFRDFAIEYLRNAGEWGKK